MLALLVGAGALWAFDTTKVTTKPVPPPPPAEPPAAPPEAPQEPGPGSDIDREQAAATPNPDKHIALTPPPLPLEEPETQAEATAAADEADALEAELKEARYQRALAHVRPMVNVTMYATKWCPHCDRARKFFAENQIRYTEHDIDASERAAEQNKELNPKGSVPTIQVDDQVVVGFSPKSVQRLIDAAAAKRAGLEAPPSP